MEITISGSLSQKTNKVYYRLCVGDVCFFIDYVQAFYICSKAGVEVPHADCSVKVGEIR